MDSPRPPQNLKNTENFTSREPMMPVTRVVPAV
jgi:hypothetical protein